MRSFDEALDHAASRHDQSSILLGNGFSIGCDPSFRYTHLLERATFGPTARHERILQLFEILDTADFEAVVAAVLQARLVAHAYGVGSGKQTRMRRDTLAIRAALANAVADVHPDRINDVGDDRLDRCAAFLSQFDALFTLSYDLLPYWAIMRPSVRGQFQDGFRWHDGDLVHTAHETLVYLHGALHLREEIDAGSATVRTIKESWDGVTPLVDRVRNNLASGHYPLFVMEGSWRAKLAKIESSTYLRSAQDHLTRAEGALFTFGWAMNEPDRHIAEAIKRSAVERLYVGIHGRAAPDQARIRAAAQDLCDRSTPRKRVIFYDSTTARVWEP